MKLAAGLREAWALAAAGDPSGGLRAVQIRTVQGRIWATVNERGERSVLIRVPPEERLGGAVAAVSRRDGALTAEVYPFMDKGQSARGLMVTCLSTELLEVFAGFCEPLILQSDAGAPVEDVFLACLQDFERLLLDGGRGTLSASGVGLLGELVILAELASASRSAIDCWSYPALERHDFRNGAVALEVKTTLRSDRGRAVVTISSIDQLDPPAGGELYLHWLRLERDPSGIVSFGALLDRIGVSAGAEQAAKVWGRIAHDQEVLAQRDTSFAVQARASYRVAEAFPCITTSRLTAGALDSGVGSLRYELDLGACEPFRCLPGDANEALLRGERD